MTEITETFFAADRAAWRAWPTANHASCSEIWLVFLKKHVGEPCVTLDEAVEEALCFGWVDSLLRRVDDRRHVLRFTPRKAASQWSASNKERAERLTREGLMAPAGLAAVAAAKKSGAWDELHLAAGRHDAARPRGGAGRGTQGATSVLRLAGVAPARLHRPRAAGQAPRHAGPAHRLRRAPRRSRHAPR